MWKRSPLNLKQSSSPMFTVRVTNIADSSNIERVTTVLRSRGLFENDRLENLGFINN